jgi:hypothetical protein
MQINAMKVSGPIPGDFGCFSALRFLDLSMNALKSTIPFTLSDKRAIEIVNLNNNQLSGLIPHNYATAVDLLDLYLNDNQLTGIIPGAPNASDTEFRIEHNGLTGTMPTSICALRGSDPNTDLVTFGL